MLPIPLDTSFEDRNPSSPVWWGNTHGGLRGSPSRKKLSIAVTRNRRAVSRYECTTKIRPIATSDLGSQVTRFARAAGVQAGARAEER